MLENKAVNQKDWGLKGGKKKLLLGVFLPLNAPQVIGNAVSFSQMIIHSIPKKNLRVKD